MIALRLDTHCHVDLYPDPTGVVQRAERAGTVVIAVTNLPSAFDAALPHVQQFRNLRLALGLHPLTTAQHSPKELASFDRNAQRTSYIGEVGLDLSVEGRASIEAQRKSFRHVLRAIQGQRKILTIHSRGAESEVIERLAEFGCRGAIFHWFTGPWTAAERAMSAGHLFSINTAMVKSPKGRQLVESLPKERVLLESDGPFIKIGRRSVEPGDLTVVEEVLSRWWGEHIDDVRVQLRSNFSSLLAGLG